jgi:hypothetical protein
VDSLVDKTSMLLTDLLDCRVPFHDEWYRAIAEPLWPEEWLMPSTWTEAFMQLRGTGVNLKNALLDRILRGDDGIQPLIHVDLLARCVASDEFLYHLKGMLLENKRAVAGGGRKKAKLAVEGIELPRWWMPLHTSKGVPAVHSGKSMMVPPPATYAAAVLLLAHWLDMFGAKEGESKPRFDYATFEPRIADYLPAVKAHHARLRPSDFAGWEGCTYDNFAPTLLGAYHLLSHDNAGMADGKAAAMAGASSGGGFLRNKSRNPQPRLWAAGEDEGEGGGGAER